MIVPMVRQAQVIAESQRSKVRCVYFALALAACGGLAARNVKSPHGLLQTCSCCMRSSVRWCVNSVRCVWGTHCRDSPQLVGQCLESQDQGLMWKGWFY